MTPEMGNSYNKLEEKVDQGFKDAHQHLARVIEAMAERETQRLIDKAETTSALNGQRIDLNKLADAISLVNKSMINHRQSFGHSESKWMEFMEQMTKTQAELAKVIKLV